MARLWRLRLLPGALILAVVLAFASDAFATEPRLQHFIPPGSEQKVLQFIEPLRLGSTVADGFVLSDVFIDGGAIRLSLTTSTGAKTIVDVVYGEPQVVVRPATDTPPAVAETIRRILLRSPAPPSPWIAVPERPPEPPEPFWHIVHRKSADAWRVVTANSQRAIAAVKDTAHRTAEWISHTIDRAKEVIGRTSHRIIWAIEGAWDSVTRSIHEAFRVAGMRIADAARVVALAVRMGANTVLDRSTRVLKFVTHAIWTFFTTPQSYVGVAGIALIVASVWLLRKRWAAIPLRPRRGLIGLTILALILREFVSPHAFLHEFYHIANWPAVFTGEMTYGMTGPVLYRMLDSIFGGSERTVFFVNSLLATLTVPVVALLDRALFGKWPRALLAGLIVCLLPVHLRFSGSEDFWVVGTFLACTSLLAWTLWLKAGGKLELVIAVLSLGLAMQSRPELLPLPAAHAALLLALRPVREWVRVLSSRTFVVAFAGLMALISFRLHDIIRTWGKLPHQAFPSTRVLLSEDTPLDWVVTPPALLMLSTLGVLWGLVYQRRITLWTVCVTAAFIVFPLTAYANRPCIYRTQMFAMVLFSLSTAGSVEWFSRKAIRWHSAALGVAVVFMTQGLWARRQFVTELLDQQLEFAFLEKAVPKLPDASKLIALYDADGAAVRWMGNFPTFLATRAHKTVERLNVPDFVGGAKWPTPTPGLLFYQGMYCYVSGEADVVVAPMRNECRDIRAHYELKPVDVRVLNTRGYSQAHYAPGPYEIGFFEIIGTKAPSTSQALK